MEEKWIWLPDWASNLALWEDELSEVASADHTFVPYEEMAKCLDDAYKISGLAKADTVVAWGMGALVLMLSVKNKPAKQKWILLSPFADFCDESSPWDEHNLQFMAKQMSQTVEPGLNSFAEQLAEEFEDWQDDWLSAAKKMSVKSLVDGLHFLASQQLTEAIENSGNIQVVYGRFDKAVLPEQTLKLKALLPKAIFKERPKAGHWPPLLLS